MPKIGNSKFRLNVLNKIASDKKTVLILLALLVLVGGYLVLCTGRSDVKALQPQTTNNVSASHSDAGLVNDNSFLTNSEALNKAGNYNTGGGELYFRAILAVLFIIVLCVAAVYVSKKLLPKITNLPGREIRLVETMHLGPHKAVHLLEVAERRFLIGCTNENISTLAEVTSSLAGLSAEQANGSFEDVQNRQTY
jgi:flagellar biosynthetic protein FliO